MSASETAAERLSRYTHTVQQIADQYGVDPRTIRRWVKDGRIQAVKIGPRFIRFDPDEVAEQLLRGVR